MENRPEKKHVGVVLEKEYLDKLDEVSQKLNWGSKVNDSIKIRETISELHKRVFNQAAAV